MPAVPTQVVAHSLLRDAGKRVVHGIDAQFVRPPARETALALAATSELRLSGDSPTVGVLRKSPPMDRRPSSCLITELHRSTRLAPCSRAAMRFEVRATHRWRESATTNASRRRVSVMPVLISVRRNAQRRRSGAARFVIAQTATRAGPSKLTCCEHGTARFSRAGRLILLSRDALKFPVSRNRPEMPDAVFTGH